MDNQSMSPQTPPAAPSTPSVAPSMTDASTQTTTPSQPMPSTMPPDVSGGMPMMDMPSQMPPAKSGHGIFKKLLLGLLIVVLLAAGGGTSAFYYMKLQKANDEIASLKSANAVADSGLHDLPADAVKLSECVPNMGYHYVGKDGDPVYGPLLLVNKGGKVIGVEYMFDNSMLQAVPNVTPPIEVLPKNTPLYGWEYNHGEVSRATEGHEGFLEDHIDLHLYTVNTEIRAKACE